MLFEKSPYQGNGVDALRQFPQEQHLQFEPIAIANQIDQSLLQKTTKDFAILLAFLLALSVEQSFANSGQQVNHRAIRWPNFPLQLFANDFRQGRTSPAGCDRYQQLSPAKMGGNVKIATGRIVGAVQQNPLSHGLSGNARLHLAIVGGGKGEKGSLQIPLGVAASQPFETPLAGQSLQFPEKLWADQSNAGPGGKQPLDLALRDLAAADNHHQTAADVEIQGVKGHCGHGTLQRLALLCKILRVIPGDVAVG